MEREREVPLRLRLCRSLPMHCHSILCVYVYKRTHATTTFSKSIYTYRHRQPLACLFEFNEMGSDCDRRVYKWQTEKETSRRCFIYSQSVLCTSIKRRMGFSLRRTTTQAHIAGFIHMPFSLCHFVH